MRAAQPGLLTLIRDGAAFVARTPLIRGLVTGIIGAFTAGGIVIGSATLYAASLGGGNAAYGLLFASVFVGLAIGMGAGPADGPPDPAQPAVRRGDRGRRAGPGAGGRRAAPVRGASRR